MTCTPTTTVIAARLSGLARLLSGNAAVLAASGLPETVTDVRIAVYGDVAAQLHRWTSDDAPAADSPLAAVPPADLDREDAVAVGLAVARQFETLAALLAANAALLTRRTRDLVMHRRSAVYRDVAAQLRILAADERQAAVATAPRTSRAPLSNTAPVSPIAVKAATRATRVRPEFLEALVAAMAARRRAGWSVARLSRWLRTTLRDPQTGAIHPCAQRSFVTYVTALLTGTQARPLRAA
ncbi:MAG TPA: hypothetical protein VGL02_26995 [Streptomyces sp.]